MDEAEDPKDPGEDAERVELQGVPMPEPIPLPGSTVMVEPYIFTRREGDQIVQTGWVQLQYISIAGICYMHVEADHADEVGMAVVNSGREALRIIETTRLTVARLQTQDIPGASGAVLL